MPRFLTPAKIGLLALAEQYLAGKIPASAKLAVLTFLASQINPPSDFPDATIEQRLQCSTGDLEELAKVLSKWQLDIPGRTVYDRLLRELWALNDVDALFVLFRRLSDLLALSSPIPGTIVRPRVSRASPLGQFIRRSCYEFERIQFADVQKLWSAFVSYRAPSYRTWAERNPDVARLDAHLEMLHLSILEQPLAEHTSTHDVNDILNLSIQHLQKLGTRVPSAVHARLRDWYEAQDDANAQSLRHFMAFFEHWRAAQMSMALESLHQYFDLSLGANRGGDELRAYFQYAQLHKSVLYADFECWEESVEAMRECIGTARENQDTACLNFALSWLLHLRQVHPDDSTVSFESLIRLLGGSTEHDEIAFLKVKAREMKHWSLMSSTLLEEAKLEMYCGGNINRAFEHILQAMFLTMQHDQRTLMPAASLFESASYERLGQSRLAYRICESAPLLHAPYAPLSDLVRATCRTAHALSQTGHFSTAKKALEKLELDVKGVTKLQDRITIRKALVRVKRLLHRDRLQEAGKLLRELRPCRTSGGSEADFDISLMKIELLMKSKDHEKALEIVSDLIKKRKAARVTDIAERLHLLILKSKIYAAAGQHAKGFSIVLRAASTAERHGLMSVLVDALAVLSSILTALGEFEAAQELAQAALPHALSGANAQLQAELFSSLVDANVGLAGKQARRSPEQLQLLGLATACVERSRTIYAQLGDVSGMSLCLTKKAMLERVSGDTAAAATTDEAYTQLLTGTDRTYADDADAEGDIVI